jgi:beta-lactamase class A
MPVSYRRPPARLQHSLNNNAYNSIVVYQNRAVVGHTGRHQRRKSSFKARAFVVAVLLLALAGHIIWSKHVSAETLAAHQAQVQAAAEAQHKVAVFQGQVATLLAAYPGDTIGVVTGSATGALVTYGSNGPYDAASDGKLLTAADYLHHVEQGTATLQQNIDGETAEYWIKIMLVNSDDNAWAELNDYLTHPDLAAYAASIGFTNYDPTVNTFLATDAASLLQKLYAGQLLNSADRSLMLGYLKQANYRGYIVAAVPGSDTVYHKIGLDDDEINDAAIIVSGQKTLILSIFTNGNGSYDLSARTQLIQSITRDAIAAYL